MIERYVLEAYHKDGNHWEELLGHHDTYEGAVAEARTIAERGEAVRIIAQKFEYTDSELVEEFKGEHRPDEDDG